MIETAALVASAGLAHAATNLDNLAIVMALVLTCGRGRVVGAYMIAQALVLAAANIVAEQVDTELPFPVGYLGVIPICVGVFTLWRSWTAVETEDEMPRVQSNLLALTTLFLGLSFDTFAVFAPLLADSRAAFSAAILAGATLSATALAIVGTAMPHLAAGYVKRIARLERYAPYVMIAVGFYVVLNTATDAV